MSKIMKTKHIPAQDVESHEATKCELCGLESTPGGCSRRNWSNDRPYGVDIVRVENEKGDYWPEGPSVETTVLDICPRCFCKLVEWFKAQGGTPRTESEY